MYASSGSNATNPPSAPSTKRHVWPPLVTKTPLSWKPQPNIVGTSGLWLTSYICAAVIPWLRFRHVITSSGTGSDVSPLA